MNKTICAIKGAIYVLSMVAATSLWAVDAETQTSPVSVTTLHEAVKNGHLEDVRALLSHGADVNEVDDKGRPLLCRAIMGGCMQIPMNKEIVKLLISSGADVNAVDHAGRSALRLAAFCRKDKEIVELLLSKGAHIGKESKGKPPLKIAEDFAYTYQKIAELLKSS
ncbi:hypothetical protein FACS1894122_12480 [Alphaproteobacteria bacterium]|nr:hypothetical protein FACS1894122_12480 [Alphaproteobacteria bacterium]